MASRTFPTYSVRALLHQILNYRILWANGMLLAVMRHLFGVHFGVWLGSRCLCALPRSPSRPEVLVLSATRSVADWTSIAESLPRNCHQPREAASHRLQLLTVVSISSEWSVQGQKAHPLISILRSPEELLQFQSSPGEQLRSVL